MGSRLFFAALIVVMFSSLAFAGPQIVISDPICNGSEINLSTNTYAFVYNGQASFTFCNTTNTTFTALNFTIATPTPIDVSGFYCGAPNAFLTAAFDYCLVLDPNQANQPGVNAQLFGQATPNEFVVHQFVTSYPFFPDIGPIHDTPNRFYQTNRCFFGCQTNNQGGVIDDLVNLSFNLYTPLNVRPENCLDQFNIPVPCGLRPNHEFTITFACDPQNTTEGGRPVIPCSDLPDGSTVSFVGFPAGDQITFPAAVPEPATIALIAGAGIPALLRRRKKS